MFQLESFGGTISSSIFAAELLEVEAMGRTIAMESFDDGSRAEGLGHKRLEGKLLAGVSHEELSAAPQWKFASANCVFCASGLAHYNRYRHGLLKSIHIYILECSIRASFTDRALQKFILLFCEAGHLIRKTQSLVLGRKQ